MKHIKEPIRLSVEHACCVLFDSDNSYVGSIPINAQGAGLEMARAVNEHDALVAQRDALAGALAELVDRFRSWSLENADDNDLPNLEIVVPVKHIQAGIAALDLAKEAQ